MLYHVTMTHTPDNCPAYQRERMPEVIASLEKFEAVAKEANVKIHSALWGAPDHVAYAILEADNLGAMARVLNAIAIKQEFRITPVQTVKEVIETGKAIMARK